MTEFRAIPMDEEPASSLIQGMRDEMAEIYEGLALDAPDMPAAGPRELGPPRGVFLVGFDDGTPVCCGGVKDLGGGRCEIKRMFVAHESRRMGLARQLLTALENAARELGYEVARLDTGPRQPHAERMYRKAGYEPIENFNANPVASFFGQKAL